jgi:hypothetical protein
MFPILIRNMQNRCHLPPREAAYFLVSRKLELKISSRKSVHELAQYSIKEVISKRYNRFHSEISQNIADFFPSRVSNERHLILQEKYFHDHPVKFPQMPTSWSNYLFCPCHPPLCKLSLVKIRKGEAIVILAPTSDKCLACFSETTVEAQFLFNPIEI